MQIAKLEYRLCSEGYIAPNRKYVNSALIAGALNVPAHWVEVNAIDHCLISPTSQFLDLLTTIGIKDAH